MRRGTTPTHTFALPFETSQLTKVRIVYAQGDAPIITKEIEDCTLEGNTITVKLTQEDTLKLDNAKYVSIQLRVLTEAEDSLVSDVIQKAIGECLDDEVL